MGDSPNQHVRWNRSVLAQMERRALEWVARRLPEAITPLHLSALGLAAMAGAGVAFAAFRWTDGYGAAAGVVTALAANWVGDSLDGTVARVRRIERPRFGYYVDHVIDLTGATFLFGGIACSGLMNPLLATALLAAYFLVSAEIYLATHATGVFRMSFAGFGPTELRIVVAAGAIKAAGNSQIAAGLQLFDAGAIVAIAGLVAAFVVSAVRNTQGLHAAEPVPRTDAPRAA